MSQQPYDVAVAGGGAIGLACAWRAAQSGLRVVVADSGDPGAWHAAAGMLAPVAEVDFGEQPPLGRGMEGGRRFEAFVAGLAAASGRAPGPRAVGTLVVARDADEAAALDRLATFRRSLGLPVERLRPSAARRAEPALAPTVRLALDVPGDHSIDPRRMVAALAEALERAGGELRRARVARILTESTRVTGVGLADGTRIAAGHVVIAVGAHVAELDGLPGAARVPVRPVKGQVLRLRDPRGPGLVERT